LSIIQEVDTPKSEVKQFTFGDNSLEEIYSPVQRVQKSNCINFSLDSPEKSEYLKKSDKKYKHMTISIESINYDEEGQEKRDNKETIF
jgi:hypothetical protein